MKLAHRMATLVLLLCGFAVRAGEVHVAVAANFLAPMQAIAADFAHDTGHRAIVTGGATGSLYAQIRNGAPFEVFLSADQKTPERLDSEGFVVPGQRFTYAVGKLVLFSATPGLVDGKGAILMDGRFTHLAIANPKTAPYGAAGYETLKAMGLGDAVQAKIVQGENIGQTFEFVSSGNAELGFVALSQVAAPGKPAKGSWWLVPAPLYSPIRQDGVLLKAGAGSDAAKALVDYLRSEKAKAVIRSYGYDL
jgi:molybdate transport system substrate-binding protein